MFSVCSFRAHARTPNNLPSLVPPTPAATLSFERPKEPDPMVNRRPLPSSRFNGSAVCLPTPLPLLADVAVGFVPLSAGLSVRPHRFFALNVAVIPPPPPPSAYSGHGDNVVYDLERGTIYFVPVCLLLLLFGSFHPFKVVQQTKC